MLFLLAGFAILACVRWLYCEWNGMKFSIKTLFNTSSFLSIIGISLVVSLVFLPASDLIRNAELVSKEIQKVNGVWYSKDNGIIELFETTEDGAKSTLVQGRITKVTYKGDKGYVKYLDYTNSGMLLNILFFPVSVIDIDALVERDIELVLPESEKN